MQRACRTQTGETPAVVQIIHDTNAGANPTLTKERKRITMRILATGASLSQTCTHNQEARTAIAAAGVGGSSGLHAGYPERQREKNNVTRMNSQRSTRMHWRNLVHIGTNLPDKNA